MSTKFWKENIVFDTVIDQIKTPKASCNFTKLIKLKFTEVRKNMKI